MTHTPMTRDEAHDAAKLLKRILSYVQPSNVRDLLYRTPAMALREAADALERKESDAAALRDLITKLENMQ